MWVNGQESVWVSMLIFLPVLFQGVPRLSVPPTLHALNGWPTAQFSCLTVSMQIILQNVNWEFSSVRYHFYNSIMSPSLMPSDHMLYTALYCHCVSEGRFNTHTNFPPWQTFEVIVLLLKWDSNRLDLRTSIPWWPCAMWCIKRSSTHILYLELEVVMFSSSSSLAAGLTAPRYLETHN